MDKKKQKTISKFMSLVLRQQPDTAGLTIGEGGWVEVKQLLQRFTLTCGREERFTVCDACFPRARTVHIFS